jgi:transposase-like protein
MARVIRNSNCLKRRAVAMIEKGGMSISESRRRYGIQGTATIRRWLRKNGKEAHASAREAIRSYNEFRPHRWLKLQTPESVHSQEVAQVIKTKRM